MWRGLVEGEQRRVDVSVERAATRRGNHLPRTTGPRPLEHPQGAEDVDHGVVDRILHRGLHVGLCGEVVDDLRPGPGDEFDASVLAQVDHLEPQPVAGRRTSVGEVRLAAGGEVVEHDDVVSVGQESVDERRADEPRSPGDDGPHAGLLSPVPDDGRRRGVRRRPPRLRGRRQRAREPVRRTRWKHPVPPASRRRPPPLRCSIRP